MLECGVLACRMLLECWSVGVLDVGVLECWSVGVLLECWSVGV